MENDKWIHFPITFKTKANLYLIFNFCLTGSTIESFQSISITVLTIEFAEVADMNLSSPSFGKMEEAIP